MELIKSDFILIKKQIKSNISNQKSQNLFDIYSMIW